MGRIRLLWTVFAVLSLAVLLVYGYRFLFRGPAVRSADEWAALALGGGTAKERQYAAVKLAEFGKPARQQILRVLDQSKHTEVRVACIQGLLQQWDYHSMPLLFELMNDPSAAVRQQAGQAVQYMAQVDRHFNKVNGDNQQAERQAVIKRLRADWEEFKGTGIGRTVIYERLGEQLN